MSITTILAEKFVTAIKARDSHPPESKKWESENTKADEIIRKAASLYALNEFSIEVNKPHHWQ